MSKLVVSTKAYDLINKCVVGSSEIIDSCKLEKVLNAFIEHNKSDNPTYTFEITGIWKLEDYIGE